jgi:hypothetical protein
VCVYLLFLVVSIPASRVTTRLEQQMKDLSLQAVTGTVISGEAARIVFQGQGIGPVSWSLRPLSLLLGRLEYHVASKDAAFRGSGTVGLGLNDVLVVRDLQAELQPGPVINRFSPVPVETTGVLKLLIRTLEYETDFPRELSGSLEWNDARILEPLELTFGEVVAVLSRGEDLLVASINSDSDDLTMAGEFTVTPSGRYNLNLVLTPGAALAPEVVDTLHTFGQPGHGGGYLITDTGQL